MGARQSKRAKSKAKKKPLHNPCSAQQKPRGVGKKPCSLVVVRGVLVTQVFVFGFSLVFVSTKETRQRTSKRKRPPQAALHK
jgi:hypothetical protein